MSVRGRLFVLMVMGLLGSWLSPPAQAAQVPCTPDPGYTNCIAVTYSGADQTVTLPANANATAVLVKAWGAGGGGLDYYVENGGGGGYASGVLNINANRALTVIVGGAGQSACWSGGTGETTGSLVPSYGGGGPSNSVPFAGVQYCGASGGGRSAIRVGAGVAHSSASSEVITAGGGGGAGSGTTWMRHQGGPGGGASGGDGSCGSLDLAIRNQGQVDACNLASGQGGTATAGGAAGSAGFVSSPFVAPTAGAQFQGGTSGCSLTGSFVECGGGGGGGYFGGGGAYKRLHQDGPGGGGSGHLDALLTGGSLLAATSYTPPNTSATQYVAGVGVGGGTGETNVLDGSDTNKPGGNGLVVIQFNLAASLQLRKSWNNAIVNNAVNLPATSGFLNNTTALASLADTATEIDDGTSVQVLTGDVGTLPAEIFTTGSSGSYNATLSCTGGGTLSGNNALVDNTLTINAADAGATIVCTYTNTRKMVDLKVVKTVSPNTAMPPGQVLTYTLTATNNGPDATTNVLLSDTASAGLDCTTPSATATCSATGGASCPGATVAVSDLLGAGVTIPILPLGGEVVVTMQCTVTATGLP